MLLAVRASSKKKKIRIDSECSFFFFAHMLAPNQDRVLTCSHQTVTMCRPLGASRSGNLDDQLRRCGIRTLMRLTHVSLAENLFDGPFPEALLNMSWLVELHLSGG